MSDEKKIVVDESWKEQVEREKQQAEAQRRATQGGEPPQPATDATDATASPPPADAAPQPKAPGDASAARLPPASFGVLVSSLAAQAVTALGLLPGPDGKPGPVHKEVAKHFIDILAVLEEKTRGNLTLDESAMLQQVLHEVRMAYVSVTQP